MHAIDSLVRERAVTCGADRTVRLWKVVDDSQLVFRANTTAPCLDCVAMVRMPPPIHDNQPHHHPALCVRLSASATPPHRVWWACVVRPQVDEKHFVTGSQGGELALWFVGRKKPMVSVPTAHGGEGMCMPW